MSEKEFSPVEIMRHSAAHVMAAAIQKLYPEVKLGVGPVIENGFYYDLDIDVQLSEADFESIMKEMKKIVDADEKFVREEMNIDDAITFFQEENQPYKVELLNDLKTKGTTKISKEETQTLDPNNVKTVSLYRTGEFVDLCRGPHVSSTREIGAFCLQKIAGAYWRGDEKNKMLQRIYGLAFETKSDLDSYLERLEEAKKRDHRKLGKDLDLFTFADLVGKGLPLWTQYGAAVRRELENFVVEEELKRDYLHVSTPDIAKVDLYRTSGHYPYYKETMYPPMQVDDDELILRPMTCPHHFMLYADKKRSYRELPMRIAELARLYRYEKSGELTGMLRVRSFTLADAHIFCMPKQVKDIVKEVLDLIEYLATKLGLEKGVDFTYRLSLGDRMNEKKYYKNDAGWAFSENVLRETLVELNAPFYEASDEAAFYGPKIDVQMKNVLGKEDTAFTVQYDLCMPTRFSLKYVDDTGAEQTPVVIHRSSIGATERIFGFLIERYAGVFPLWLSPVQVQLISVASDHRDFCQSLRREMLLRGLRVEVDEGNETVGNKIRKASNMKIPYILVIGDKELNGADFQIRVRGHKDQMTMNKDAFYKLVEEKIAIKDLTV